MPSREPELYKDKIEVSLDGRQIFYLFFGGSVIIGLVFVLGVMVGRRVEARGHVDHARTKAATDPLAALDGLETPGLSFKSTLSGTPAGKPPDVERAINDIANARAAKPAAKPEPKKADAPKPDAKPAAKPEGKPVVKPDQAQAKPKPAANEPANPDVVTKSEDKPKPAAPEKGKFTLQLSSFQDKQEAESFLSSVKAAGYQAYVTEAEVSGKGMFYRVRLGTYRSLEAANDAKVDVEKALKKTASVMRL